VQGEKLAHLASRFKGAAFGPQQDILEVQFHIVVDMRHGASHESEGCKVGSQKEGPEPISL
jgi:hypothetical protein